jgi:hypothetical protein
MTSVQEPESGEVVLECITICEALQLPLDH